MWKPVLTVQLEMHFNSGATYFGRTTRYFHMLAVCLYPIYVCILSIYWRNMSLCCSMYLLYLHLTIDLTIGHFQTRTIKTEPLPIHFNVLIVDYFSNRSAGQKRTALQPWLENPLSSQIFPLCIYIFHMVKYLEHINVDFISLVFI